MGRARGRHERQGEGRALGVGHHAQGGGDPLAADPEAEDEVAIQPLSRLQPHALATTRCLVDDDRVQARPQRADVQAAGIDVHRQPQPDGIGEAGEEHRRGDARGIGHRVGVRRHASAHALAPQRHARDVAGRDDQRKAEGGLAILVGERAR